MSFFQTVGDWVTEVTGLTFGAINQATQVVGVYTLMIMIVIGFLLFMAGFLAKRMNYSPVWMGPAAIGTIGVTALQWAMIPGFPIMSLLGVVLGAVAIFVAVMIYKNPLKQETSRKITSGVGIALLLFSLIAIFIEIAGGGGLLV